MAEGVDSRGGLLAMGSSCGSSCKVEVPNAVIFLHRDHGHVVRMKTMAWSYMWWTGMDTDIESIAKSCVSCKAVKSAPREATLYP